MYANYKLISQPPSPADCCAFYYNSLLALIPTKLQMTLAVKQLGKNVMIIDCLLALAGMMFPYCLPTSTRLEKSK
jgi:hypothetical protein